jgi:hypothetical protein
MFECIFENVCERLEKFHVFIMDVTVDSVIFIMIEISKVVV